ncbi:hypothetical protein [Dongia sp.]|uniref:hypothetical protein n=1 Tax=Dongia sp. TaxID=1977262 RepID=UPI0035B3799C
MRRALALLSLKIWSSLDNPAWNLAAVAERELGTLLNVSVDPRRIRRKIAPKEVAPIKDRFLVDGLGVLASDPIQDLYTYMDMADIARHGDDLTRTRLYQWLKASWQAGRPVEGRGQVFNSEAAIEAYYRTYLGLYRSMQRDGYRYSGDDDICLGVSADGEIVHIRRGTHRMAAAQILELPSVSARITHIDRAFARSAASAAGGDVRSGLARAIKAVTG